MIKQHYHGITITTIPPEVNPGVPQDLAYDLADERHSNDTRLSLPSDPKWVTINR